jgi:hypothetical protein
VEVYVHEFAAAVLAGVASDRPGRSAPRHNTQTRLEASGLQSLRAVGTQHMHSCRTHTSALPSVSVSTLATCSHRGARAARQRVRHQAQHIRGLGCAGRDHSCTRCCAYAATAHACDGLLHPRARAADASALPALPPAPYAPLCVASCASRRVPGAAGAAGGGLAQAQHQRRGESSEVHGSIAQGARERCHHATIMLSCCARTRARCLLAP